MSIRVATDADAAALAAVHSASAALAYADIFPPTAVPPTPADLTPEWTAMVADPAGAVFVAVLDGEVVAAVALKPDADEPDALFLARLYVHPDHWHRGYGTALHDHAVTVGHERCETLRLWVLENNAPARRMYERRGWQLVPGMYLDNDPPEVKDVLYTLVRPDA